MTWNLKHPAPLLAALLGALAFPAGAQTLEYSPEATETCLQDGRAADCIGASAKVCIEAPDGYTTVGMGYCLDQELKWWDARLNEVYGRLREADRADDAEMKELSSNIPEKAPALRDMQRAWIPFRDALCDYERVQWGGGSGSGPATLQCLMEETARQTLRLEARMRMYEER